MGPRSHKQSDGEALRTFATRHGPWDLPGHFLDVESQASPWSMLVQFESEF